MEGNTVQLPRDTESQQRVEHIENLRFSSISIKYKHGKNKSSINKILDIC